MAQEPRIVERAEQPYVGIRDLVTMDTIPQLADRYPEIFAFLGQRGLQPAGAPFFRYHIIDMERELDMEAGVPVSQTVEGEGDIRYDVLPAGRYATVTHRGHPGELVDVTRDLLAWAEAQDLTWDLTQTESGESWGARLEFYLTDPAEQPDMNQWDVQLAFRLAD
jgi:effector-binding domain-containing protein